MKRFLQRLRSLSALAAFGSGLAAIVLVLGVVTVFHPGSSPDALPYQPQPVPIITDGAVESPSAPVNVVPRPVPQTSTPSPKASGPVSPSPSQGRLTGSSSPTPSPVTVRVEAEDAWLSNAITQADHRNYSGTGFVDYYNMIGSFIEWNVRSARSRQATLSIRYANASPSARQMNITVNGAVVAANVDFPPTPNWDTWQTRTVTIPLPRGGAAIRMTAVTTAGGPNVDYCDLT